MPYNRIYNSVVNCFCILNAYALTSRIVNSAGQANSAEQGRAEDSNKKVDRRITNSA